MATSSHIRIVEQVIGYSFETKSLIAQALTAADRGEEQQTDGNRKLAMVGEHLIQFLISWSGYRKDASRDTTAKLKDYAGSKKQRALAAQRTGISDCIKFSPRSGSSELALSLAISAIVGATWEESQDLDTVATVILRLGITTKMRDSVQPQMVLLDHSTNRETAVEMLFSEHITTAPYTNTPCLAAPSQPSDDSFETFASSNSLANVDTIDVLEPSTALDGAEPSLENDLIWLEDVVERNLTCASPSDATGQTGIRPAQSIGIEARLQPPSHDSVSEGEGLHISSNVGEEGTTQSQSTSSIITKRNHRKTSNTTTTQKSERQIKKARRSANEEEARFTQDLQSYLEQELLRCQKQAILGPLETFFRPEIQRRIVESGNGTHSRELDALETICVGIASPESLATLQLLLRSYRAGERLNVPAPAWALSIKDRFSVIEYVGREISYMNLLRRCHILKLYEDNREVHHGATNGFLMITQQNFTIQGRQRVGNPILIAESKITKRILEQTYPNLVPDSPEYDTKHRIVNDVRRLGKRLHMLTDRFGHGVLGLLQCAGYSLGIESSLDITDAMILAPRDSAFENFVTLLDQSQGDTLRQFSEAISPIMENVLQGTLCNVDPFPIEYIEQKDILELPKGSVRLLQLISRYA